MKLRASLATVAVLSAFWTGPVAAEGIVQLSAPDASKELLELLQNSSLTEQADAVENPTALDLFAASRADYDRLLGIMYDQGYYSTVISIRIDGKEAAEIQPMDAPSRIGKIDITVISGPRFHFGRTVIGPLAPKTDIPAGYSTGRIAHSSLILDAARAGVTAWKEDGHAKARVGDQKITANHRDNIVSSDIRLAPGPEVRFGTMDTSGNKRLRTERLVEIAGFPTGKKFSPERVEQVRERLRRTGMFSSITLTEDKDLHSGNVLDYELGVVEEKPRRIGGGAEYGSSEGLSLSGYWLHRDLLGGGERLRVDASVEGIGGSSDSGSMDYSIGARLDRPATLSPDTSAFFITRLSKDTYEDYTEWGGQFGGGLTHRFNDRLIGETGVGYVWSRVTDDFGDTIFRQIALPNSLTWDNRNSPTDATQGYFGLLRLTPFYGLGQSTGSGMQLVGDVRAYRSVMENDRLVLAGRAQIGAVYGSSLGRTPRSYLFYSGGGGTVRGQPYQSLGVNELYDGQLKTGGTRFLGFSGEARVGITESIGIVAFYDTGFVSANEFFGSGGAWQAGAGIGLRYKTPIGPIRLDVAAPVSGDTGDGVQLYLGIGQAF